MESKSREAFESWALSECGTADITKVEGRYFHPKTRVMWEAWQASREALVVELPESFEVEMGAYGDAEVVSLSEVTESLRAAGITVKGEGDE